jgi:hypothetical protein
MPTIVQGNQYFHSSIQLRDVNYDYDYPNNLNWKPGSELHERLKSLILQRSRESRDFMQKRYKSWRKIDKNLTSYIPATDAEKKIKDDDDRKPVNVVIPVSYAILETLLTYFTATFFDEPIFRYQGVGPEDTVKAMLLELVISQQVHRQKMLLDLYVMWRDSLTYGFGAVSPVWIRKTGKRTVKSEEGLIGGVLDLFRSIGLTRREEEVVIYEGNSLQSIDPYMLLPDPNVSAHKIQDSEFVGWVDRSNRMKLLSEENSNDGRFNARYLEHIDGKSIYWEQDRSARTERFGIESSSSSSNIALSTKPVDLIFMYMNIVPSEWSLRDSDRPERWLFVLAGDQVIIQAQPLGLDHDQFPIAICCPDYDGHSVAPIGKLEIEYGMQEAVDFLYKSFQAEQRKSVNNTFVVDPEVINIHDFANTKNGGLVRLRRKFWGQGKVADAIHQVQVNDVTQQNIPNIQFLHGMMKETSGAVDALQGLFRKTSERVSATESQNTVRSALSRLEKAARLAGWQAHYDIAYQLASNTRQLLDEETFVRLVGRHEQDLKREFGLDEFAKISPSTVDVDFDVLSHDGTLPIEGSAQTLLQLIQMAAQDQELRQTLDYVRLVKAIARRSGEKNVEDFVRKQPPVQTQVVSDQQAEREAQAGNLVPLNGTFP